MDPLQSGAAIGVLEAENISELLLGLWGRA